MGEVMVNKKSYHSGKHSISAESADFEQLMCMVWPFLVHAAGIDGLESIDSRSLCCVKYYNGRPLAKIQAERLHDHSMIGPVGSLSFFFSLVSMQ